MEIKTINGRTIDGISESEIKKAENRFGIKFPLAFKEYLYLAGDSSGGLKLADDNGSLAVLTKDDVRKKLEKSMQEFQIPIKWPFWVFSEKDGFQQFFFIYPDEN